MTTPAQTPEEGDSGLVFESLESFVNEYLTQVLWRPADGQRFAWCAEWWRHPEALVRLAGMWRAFEYLRVDAAMGMSNWWLHHADPQLAVLMDAYRGPFVHCTGPEGHQDVYGPLPYVPVPPGVLDLPQFSLAAADAEEAARAAAAQD